MRKFLACLSPLLLLLITQVTGQPNQPVATANRIALRADRLLDVRTGKILTDPLILIEKGKVTSLTSSKTDPPGYQMIQLGNVTLLPGLIDCHTHLLHHYDGTHPNALNETARKSTAARALMGSVMAREMLRVGFTTVRDLGNSGVNGDVALRDAINANYVVGPRMIVSTRALAPVGGQFGMLTHGTLGVVKQEYVEIVGVDEARKAVRQAIYDGANCIKVIANSMHQYLSTDELRTIVEEAHRLGRKVAVHATGGQAIGNCIDAGVDSIEHGYDLTDDEINRMAKKKIFLVPTDEPNIPSQQSRLARAFKGGVPIAAGADQYAQGQNKGKANNAENPLLFRGTNSLIIFKSYVQAGMSPLQAIQAGTIQAGELLGYPDLIGSIIEVGKPADIIAVRGDILQDITALDSVGFVMKAGQVYFNTYGDSKP